MNLTKKGLLTSLAVFVSLSLACNLISAAGGGAPTSNGGSSSSGVDPEIFVASPDLPMIRKDKSNFNASQFVARSIPVEVTFTGDATAQVVFKGALAEPNYNISATPPKKLNLYIVLQKDAPNFLYQDGEDIKTDQWVMDWQVDLLDATDNVLSTVVLGYKNFTYLYSNYPQAFKGYIDQIPENTSRARVTVSMKNAPIQLSCYEPTPTLVCATTADLNFKVPATMVSITPVQLSLKLGNWNETYKTKAVLGEFTFKYKNPYNKQMDYHSSLLFLDDSGSLVGYWESDIVVDPNSVYDRNQSGDFYQASYFSAVPTRTLVFNSTLIIKLFDAAR